MNKVLYVFDQNDEKEYHYNITEDTIIYHYSLNSDCKVDVHLVTEGVTFYYYYNNINYDDHTFSIDVHHGKGNKLCPRFIPFPVFFPARDRLRHRPTRSRPTD